jgi:FkbH-like protein
MTINTLIKEISKRGIHLSVENESLKVKAPKGGLDVQIITEIKSKKQALIKLLQSTNYSVISKTPLAQQYPLSTLQFDYWVLNKMEQMDAAHNIFNAFICEGVLSIDYLKQAFESLINRHEILRTVFKENEDGVAHQVPITNVPPFHIERHNIESKNLNSHEIDSFIYEEKATKFDLATLPLFKVSIVILSPSKSIICCVFSHLIADGWSMPIVMKEILSQYNQLHHQQTHQFKPLTIQYKDYSAWLNNRLESEEIEQHKKYWFQKLSGNIPSLNLPTFKKRPIIKTYNGNALRFKFESQTTQQLYKAAQEHDVSLFTSLVAIINVLLYKYTGNTDIVLGTMVAGREHTDLEHQIGMYANTIAMRSSFDEKVDFSTMLKLQKETILADFEHQQLPFQEVLKTLHIKRVSSRSPLFDIIVILQNQNAFIDEKDIAELTFKMVPYDNVPTSFSQLDIKFEFIEYGNDLNLNIVYNTDIYEELFISGIFDHLQKLINQLIVAPHSSINQIELIPKHKLQPIINQDDKQQLNESLTIISSFTADHLLPRLEQFLSRFDQAYDIQLGNYHQVFQELIVAQEQENAHDDYLQGEQDAKQVLEDIYKKFMLSIESHSNSKLIVVFLPVNEEEVDKETLDYIYHLHTKIQENTATLPTVYTLDLSHIQSLYPSLKIFDELTNEIAHIPYTEDFFVLMAQRINRLLWGLKQSPCKVIALDCDNTLWQGVCGENEVNDLKISKGYKALQEFAIRKYKEGFLLVLLSKNNEEEVWNVFDNHPDMLLKREHILAWKINWEAKSNNIRSLAKNLNLGLDSFAFIDDNPLECDLMMKDCPQVLTLELPSDHNHFSVFTESIIAFDKLKVSQEDKLRNVSYQANNARAKFREKLSIEEFLEDLRLTLSFNKVQQYELERVAQLTQRTNQFNLNGIKNSVAEITEFVTKENHECFVVYLQDKFGDYGLIGAVCVSWNDEALSIEHFMLSCRVLGRRIEDVILSILKEISEQKGCHTIIAQHIKTQRNIPFQAFMEQQNWQVIQIKDKIYYQLFTKDISNHKAYITLYKDQSLPNRVVDKKEQNTSFVSHQSTKESQNGNSTLKPTLIDKKDWVWEGKLVNENQLVHKLVYKALNDATLEAITSFKLNMQPIQEGNSSLYEAPQTYMEETVIVFFEDLLQKTPIGINDSFFELGGSSIVAIQLISKIYKSFGYKIPLTTIFETNTIKGISILIQQHNEVEQWLAKPLENNGSHEELEF